MGLTAIPSSHGPSEHSAGARLSNDSIMGSKLCLRTVTGGALSEQPIISRRWLLPLLGPGDGPVILHVVLVIFTSMSASHQAATSGLCGPHTDPSGLS